jgi:hypothetical protein
LQLDLRFSIVTIGPLEPALLLSLVVASLATWFMGKGLGKVTGLVADPWRRRLYMGPVWLLAGIAFFFLSNLLVVLAYPALHPEDREAMVCVAMVWPTFLVPTIIGMVAAVHALRADIASRAAPSAA